MSNCFKEDASSCKEVSLKSRRGFLGFGCICSRGMRKIVVAASITSVFSAPVVVLRSESMLCNNERIPFS